MGLIHGDDIGDTPLPPFSTAFPHFTANPALLSKQTDPFTLTPTNGMLPTQLPIRRLPAPFDVLSDILDKTPILKEDGTAGLLATYSLGPYLDGSENPLPDLTEHIDRDEVKNNLHLITALFRDYSFLASSYLLEPCWEKYSNSVEPTSNHLMSPIPRDSAAAGNKPDIYGLGRPVLPHSIAGPLVKCGAILDIPPFMSYAASYALYNYYLADPSKGHEDYSNIRLIRAFEKGLDPKSSEAGFILTHIHMVAQTGGLVSGAVGLINAIDDVKSKSTALSQAQPAIKQSLNEILDSMQIIETNMEAMWHQSLPKDYISYRTFIFGIKSQSFFPNGVIYEGCFNNEPQYFRGESGANDSIIPLLDNLCEVPMPKNPLTEILREFREYRPKEHRQLLSWVLGKSTQLGVRDFLCSSQIDKEIVVMYLRVLDHIRSFRWRHWMFAREYIIKRTSHPTATGGSPIVTWLPNQLTAVMNLMETVYQESGLRAVVDGQPQGGLEQADKVVVSKLMDNVADQKVRLAKEVKKYCEERGV